MHAQYGAGTTRIMSNPPAVYGPGIASKGGTSNVAVFPEILQIC